MKNSVCYSTSKAISKLVFILVMGSVNSAFPCAVEHEWPETMDSLSFIEPTIVKEKIFKDDYLYSSQNYGLETPTPDDSNYDYYGWAKKPWSETGNTESANLDEWITYFNSKGPTSINRQEIFTLIYGGEIKEEIVKSANDSYYQQRFKGLNEWLTSVPQRTMIEAFKSFPDAIDYSKFIVEYNPVMDRFINGGQYDEKLRKWVDYQGDPETELKPFYQKAIERAYDKKVDEFIRVKYGFQLIRMIGLMKRPDEEAVKIYNQVIGPSSIQTYTRFRAMGDLAGVYLHKGNKTKALTLYAEVSDQCLPLRPMCLFSVKHAFTYEEHEAFIKSLTNDHKITTAYYLMGLRDNRDTSSEVLENMAAHGKNDAQTEAMLVRILQRVENEDMLTDRFFLVGTKTEEEKSSIVDKFKEIAAQTHEEKKYAKLVELCQKVGADPEVKQKSLWNMAGSYLALLEGDTVKADVLYQSALKTMKAKTPLSKQIHLIGTLLELQKDKKTFSLSAQKSLLVDIQWAKTLGSDGHNMGLYHSLWVLAGEKFLTVGDLPRSILCFASAKGPYGISSTSMYIVPFNLALQPTNFLLDAVANEEELVKLENLIKGKNGTSLDRLAIKESALTVSDMCLIRAVKRIRNDDYDGALVVLKSMPKSHSTKSSDKVDWHNKQFYSDTAYIEYKTVSFNPLNRHVIQNAKTQSMNILEYTQMMSSLMKKWEKAKNAHSKKFASLCYEIGNIYGTEDLTGWPEFRRPNPSSNIHTYYPDMIEKFPLGMPGTTELLEKRYKKFTSDCQDYNEKGIGFLKQAVESNADRELTAKSLASIASIQTIEQNGYKFAIQNEQYEPIFNKKADWTKHNTDEARLTILELKKDYGNTEFYQSFKSWCTDVIFVK